MHRTGTLPSLSDITAKIKDEYPSLSFVEGARFSWHAGDKRISFKHTGNIEQDIWSLLHEVGHALLNHEGYGYDIELLQFESAAWKKATELAGKFAIEIDSDYIQDCLDTYRDWLHLRATCPNCFSRTLQASPHHYHCINCATEWQVTRSRLCRPYRMQTTA